MLCFKVLDQIVVGIDVSVCFCVFVDIYSFKVSDAVFLFRGCFEGRKKEE